MVAMSKAEFEIDDEVCVPSKGIMFAYIKEFISTDKVIVAYCIGDDEPEFECDLKDLRKI